MQQVRPAETLEEIDERLASLLQREKVLAQVSRENPGIEELITKIALDQFPRVNSRYKSAGKNLAEFREQFYSIISAEVREAKQHDLARKEFNSLAVQCPYSVEKLLHSDSKYEDSLSFFQYHGYSTGFEGGVMDTD